MIDMPDPAKSHDPVAGTQEAVVQRHHGGAWKVAATDFFTAMMALFMVMWILAQDDEVLEDIAHYFNNPYTAFQGAQTRKDPIDIGASIGMVGISSDPQYEQNKTFIEQMAQEFIKHLGIDPTDEEAVLTIQTTNDGMILRIFDRTNQPIFEPYSAQFTEWGDLLLRNIAWLIDRYDLKVRIEAHTQSGFQSENPDYTAWELTADQANAVRRSLVFHALDPEKLARVTAFGDSSPLEGLSPDSESNQRIEISLEPR
ncbi:MAG: Motility protein B [Verrucomicrobia bacterium ADurb.Bin474]|nr:MAG: Motility protein B [Verrucomicrobia bacterium ADurb.Bin474]